ncbi:hypothetical protein ERJ75_000746700 [Trypanosoma vivax]|uniref:Putative Golgi/lysosome glycoprotein 1 n=1 Tax=Trypanosoma vivax (strain Y486) TaxID=1055687 RepID=G0U0C0_TRYVY|nr:putative Golgi/lysosome glycoprotein 1 [Trypanosoma vivax]KAH8613903.1 hypothetical protein ERJ75_000746700 [Trypanosoma vivax]CCC49518.1 putative Golgi/lysosome glycoprotein 1 [Trypanosoma vivax Y486]
MKRALVLTLIFASLQAAAIEELFPNCAGDNDLLGFSSAGSEVIVHRIANKSANLTIFCLSTQITNSDDDAENDACRIPGQSEYDYKLLLRATYTDKATNKAITKDFELKDLAGGSLGAVSYRLPEKSEFSIVFINTGTDGKCSLKLRGRVYYELKAKETHATDVPVVVGLLPRVAAFNTPRSSRIIVRYPDSTAMQHKEDDIFHLGTYNQECAGEHFSGTVMERPIPTPSFDQYSEPETLGVREFTHDHGRLFRICYASKNATESVEIATLKTYDSNPVYYQIVSGKDEEGRVHIGNEVTIKFYGFDLNTRADGDRAKFVLESQDCTLAPPAGGVPDDIALEPVGNYGPKSLTSLWTWTLTDGGAYKICYKRSRNAWVEVPSWETITSLKAAVNSDLDESGSRIRPTDPVTREECPVAKPHSKENPWSMYKSIKLVLNDTKLSEDFLAKLGRKFCIPRAALAVTHLTHNEHGQQVVYLSILCEDMGEDRSCSTVERQNYIVSLAKSDASSFASIGIAAVEGSTHMFAFGDDVMIVKSGFSIMSILIICATALLVTTMMVYGFLKYRESRQYFVNFGLEDDDVDDMYISNAPGGAGKVDDAYAADK